MIVEKHLIGQKLIVPYMKDAENDILFTMKGITMKFYREVYGMRMHLLTRFEQIMLEKQKIIMADLKI